MKKFKIRKTYILVAVYVTLIIIELFYCVPYHRIQIFRTSQNVPHAEIIGSGYATMADIEYNKAYFGSNKYTSNEGKTVNTPQIFINVSITTVLAVAIYFLFPKKDKKIKDKNIIEDDVQIPLLDINALAFATEEEIAQVQTEYAMQMVEYIKRKVDL